MMMFLSWSYPWRASSSALIPGTLRWRLSPR